MNWPSNENVTKLAAELYEVGLHSVGPDDLDNRQIAERLLVLWSLSAKREPVVMSKDATNAAVKKALARREREAREASERATVEAVPVDHTASYVFDVTDPHTEERYSLYRCDTCFALVLSEDAADHGQRHAEVSA